MNFDTNRYSRRIAISIVVYLLFMYYVCHSPTESVFTNITSLVFMFGFFALVAIFAFIALYGLILLTSYIFYFLGGSELQEWVWDSFNKSAGLIAALVVLFLLFLPIRYIWSDPYRFPYLHSFLNSIVSAILKK